MFASPVNSYQRFVTKKGIWNLKIQEQILLQFFLGQMLFWLDYTVTTHEGHVPSVSDYEWRHQQVQLSKLIFESDEGQTDYILSYITCMHNNIIKRDLESQIKLIWEIILIVYFSEKYQDTLSGMTFRRLQ